MKKILQFIAMLPLILSCSDSSSDTTDYSNTNANNAGLTTNMYIRNQAFSGSYLYNRAAAASVILFIIIVILSSILFYILRDKDEAKIKKLRKQELRAARKGL